ncbi:Uma2 family endonuclease [Vacuolonema iberomarrocanum]|uniref:Uma2 family endonuclease n=1 Tax=Vacuolonema iberomarrocanum TaxID=3454632 RepID=UPI001A0285D1|nr:Uma2 family endonuclease [filamentous cyanobacterium LEGE 07170]
MTQSATPNTPPELPIPINLGSVVTEDDTPVDNFLSAKLQRLLVEALYSSWANFGMDRPFIADADIGIFATVHHPPIVPDVFVSVDVEAPQDFREKKNRAYFVWEFGKSPDVVIEIVSNREDNELGSKLDAYARLGIPYYVVFDPLQQLGDEQLRVFGLMEGRYRILETPWLEQVGLGLMLWDGEFEGIQTTWLRWCDRHQTLLPTGHERAMVAEAKAAQLAAQLRALGIEPEG